MKVFISHDSRDKERFVDNFARKLMENGIDVWYDKWELRFGDSLMKIFEDMPDCDVFISVISGNSIESKWVKEESDLAFIRKIEKNMRFIPVVLMEDNIDVPNEFNHILQCRISDVNDYEDEFKKLVGDIYGISTKPPKGKPPKYILETPIKGYELIDSIIIKSIGDYILENGDISLDFEDIMELVDDYEFSKEDINDSIEILESKYIISFTRFLGNYYPGNIKLTYYGKVIYAENYMDNLPTIVKDITQIILDMGRGADQNDFEIVDAPNSIIIAILELFSKKGYFKLQKYTNDSFYVYMLNGTGRRTLRKFLDG